MAHSLRAATGRVVAAIIATASDGNIGEGEVGARVTSTKDVVVGAVAHGTGDTLEGNAGDGDAVGWVASGTTVLVILLNVNTVIGYFGEGNVAVDNVGDAASSVRVGLDAAAVLGVDDNRVREGDISDNVVRLATNRSDAETVATRAIHVVNSDVAARGDCDTVVLVVYSAVGQDHVVCRRNIETVSVVACGIPVTSRVGSISGGVV